MFADGFDTEGLICIIHGTEQLMVHPWYTMVKNSLFECYPRKKKRLFAGLYINKIDCAPCLLHFPFFYCVMLRMTWTCLWDEKVNQKILWKQGANTGNASRSWLQVRSKETKSAPSSHQSSRVRVMTRAADRRVAWGDTRMMIMDLRLWLYYHWNEKYWNGRQEGAIVTDTEINMDATRIIYFFKMLNTDYKLINNTNPRIKTCWSKHPFPPTQPFIAIRYYYGLNMQRREKPLCNHSAVVANEREDICRL